MPQLDFSVFSSQLFWLAISFFVMLFIMAKFIVPKTAEMINLRKEKIDADIEAAAKLKQKVEKTLEKYNQALKKASEEANVSLLKTKNELSQTIERKQADLAAVLKRQIDDGEKKILASRKKTMAEVDEMVLLLAPELLNKIGFEKVSAKALKEVLTTMETD